MEKGKIHTPKYSDERRMTVMLYRDPVQPCVAGKCIQQMKATEGFLWQNTSLMQQLSADISTSRGPTLP